MSKQLRHLFTAWLFLGLTLAGLNAQAAWWEFGRSEGEPVITDIKFNKVDVSRAEDRVVLTREDLEQGVVTVRGRAEVRRGLVGLVEYSVDGGNKWHKATLGDRGLFSFDLRPELEREYDFRVRALTTTGQISDQDDHSFLLMISAVNPQEGVRQAFMQLLRAYMEENRSAFMRLVSRDFEGNETALEDAVTDDFRYLDNIRIEPNIARVAQFDKTYEVYFTFNRSVQTRSGAMLRDSAATIAGFVREGEGFKLSRMSAPLIFGISNPDEIATSVTTQSVGSNVITLDPRTGEASTQAQTSTVGGASVNSGTVTSSITSQIQFEGFEFDTDSETAETNPFPPNGDIAFSRVPGGDFILWFKGGVENKPVAGTIDSVTTAPEGGYVMQPEIFNPPLGTYVLRLLGNKYAVIEITSITPGGQPDVGTVIFRYKYQPNGSRNF
ncbi:MAG: hypothetical protein Q8Q28_04195 [Pseudomonadota bacterium]|nr:hypothetical protein [Pseudomonadota bacterium]